ncbi:MAG: 3-phosphoglycerate dehydrogenase [Muribaculaceae bacterium]|nr:3-phosphoglycerate dehydrogenase [Muribaculaceae bacterium]
MNILVATEKPFAAEAVEGIRKEVEQGGHTLVLLEKYTDKQQLLNAVAAADALIVRSDKVDADVIEAGKNLKIVVRAGAGYDNIDLVAATNKGIIVENTPGQNSNAVAELVFGMLIKAARNGFNGSTGRELRGKRLGTHAFGQVARQVARIAKGFEMTVGALSSRNVSEEGVIQISDIDELYSNYDIVSLHIPAKPNTIGLIGYDLVSKMPKGGILVNTARKEVIDEAGLMKALEERPDLTYLSDLRPSNADEWIEKFANRVYFTPKKLGAQTAEANINAGIAAACQIVSYFANGDETFRVN